MTGKIQVSIPLWIGTYHVSGSSTVGYGSSFAVMSTSVIKICKISIFLCLSDPCWNDILYNKNLVQPGILVIS